MLYLYSINNFILEFNAWELRLMKYKATSKNAYSAAGIVSFTIPLILFLFILNWYLKITPFQKLQGLPIIISPYISVIALILSLIIFKKSSNKFARLGIIGNSILFILSSLYMFFGTIIGGP